MRFNNQIKTLTLEEAESMIWKLKAQMYNHIEERQHTQLSEKYMSYLEDNISELYQYMNEKKTA